MIADTERLQELMGPNGDIQGFDDNGKVVGAVRMAPLKISHARFSTLACADICAHAHKHNP
jgi:hypothetical protein